MVRRQVSAVLQKSPNGNGNGNGNGHGNGNGYGENGGTQPEMTDANPWSLTPAPMAPPEPREIDFAPGMAPGASSVSFTAPQPAAMLPAPMGGSMPMAPQPPESPAPPAPVLAMPAPEAPPLVEAEPVADSPPPSAPPASAGMAHGAAWSAAAIAAVGAGAAAAAAAVAIGAVKNASAPQVPQTPQEAATGFMNAAAAAAAANPPQVIAESPTAPPAPSPSEPLSPPPAASTDFFSEQPPAAPSQGETQPAGRADYELGNRSDFFASSSAPAKEASPPQAAAAPVVEPSSPPPVTPESAPETPPVAGDMPPPAVSDEHANAGRATAFKAGEDSIFDEPSPGQPTKKAAAAGGPDSFDFFASSSFLQSGERRAAENESRSAKSAKEAPPPTQSSEDVFSDEPPARPKRRKERIVSDQDDEEERPKVAAPLGYKPKDSSVTLKVQDRDEDDDEDEEEEEKPRKKSRASEDSAPPRRSFTSKSGAQPKKSSKKRVADDDDDDTDQDAEGPAKKSDKASGTSFFDQQVNFMGLNMSRMNQVFLIGIMGFVAVVAMSVVGTLFTSFTGGGGGGAPQQGAAPQSLSGQWTTSASSQTGGQWNGIMTVVQRSPDKFDAAGKDQGADGRPLPYDVSGEIKNDGTISFAKAYRLLDQQTGQAVHDKPVFFEGHYFPGQNGMLIAKGTWQAKKAKGAFLHHTVITITGDWTAQMVQSSDSPGSPVGDPVNNGFSSGHPIASSNLPGADQPMASQPSDFHWFWESWPMSTRFLAMAGVAIAFIVTIVGFSLTLFGPAGKMNIWAKQKYIPSQFQSQHRKMLASLCKPYKPGGLPLGRRIEWAVWKPWEWAHKELAMPPEMRRTDPHMLVLGAGDKGKTRLMANMVVHDIESDDRAVIVIDSDGGLTDMVIRWIAANPKGKEIAKRVIVLDPTAKHGSLGYNPLEVPDDGDLQSAASAIVYGFKAMYTEPPGSQSQWNAQTANILRNTALLLMANGKTLTDIPTLVNDNDFRDVMLEAIEKKKHERAEYITLLDTWGQYKRLARTDQWINWVEPILNRVTPMLGDSRIRNILTKPHGEIKLRKIIEDKKILLVKVAKGQLDQNANLLGSLIVTGVKAAAQSLANDGGKQHPCALYLDEFDNFIEKETIETICSETDKFKIGFIGAIKTLQHLPEDFRNQIVINVGTCACFALAKKDGDVLGPQMFRVDGRKIKHQTIQNFFNKVNTSPQFELISDEEKLNIDRVVGQEARTFYCYRVGTVAGVFHLRAHDFNDIPDKDVNFKLVDRMRGVKAADKKSASAPVTETVKAGDRE